MRSNSLKEFEGLGIVALSLWWCDNIFTHRFFKKKRCKKVIKKELIRTVKEVSGVDTLKTAESVINAMLKTIMDELKKGEDVTILGFGSFRISNRKAKEGRNPKTGEKIKIKASKLPVFKASKTFKEYVNQNNGKKRKK